MQVRILGSAAGGGLPQWNCNCLNCEAVRAESAAIRPRTQSSVAVTADGGAWFQLNVSPDIRQQMISWNRLWPPAGSRRGTTVVGCVLTDAEIDHTSGLLQLREGCTLGIFSTATVRRWLQDYLPVEKVLTSFADRRWAALPLDDLTALPLPDGSASGLKVRVFEVGRDVPRFVPERADEAIGSVVGLEVHDERTGGKLIYAPGVATIDETLLQAVAGANCILIDGTFWSDDEPIQMGITSRTAREMGHIPVGGQDGTLVWLATVSADYRTYVHINNTNPMLNEMGPEHGEVVANGVRVGFDGDEYQF